MAYSDLAIASTSVGSSGTYIFDPSDFTARDGTTLGQNEAVYIRTIIHESDITINRVSDPNSDSTFEIREQIESRTGGGERHSDTLVITGVEANLEIENPTGSAQDVTLIGEHVDSTNVFVETATDITDGSELTRTTPGHDIDESVLEIVAGGDCDVVRRYDSNDDGTYEFDATIDTIIGPDVQTETWLAHVDVSGRTNPAMQTALLNNSGGTADYMLIGTITT
jgi:hypothetical protein